MNLDERTINSKQIYDGRVVKLYLDDVELADGKKTIRECIRHSGGAAVLFIKDNKIAMVKQFRYPYGKAIYEIPAGKIDKGENPENTARRELEEETGYTAKTLKFMFKLYPTPGYTDEIIYVYYAEDAEFTHVHLDEGENLNCEFLPVEEVERMCKEGEICDAKTLCAVYKYLLEQKIN